MQVLTKRHVRGGVEFTVSRFRYKNGAQGAALGFKKGPMSCLFFVAGLTRVERAAARDQIRGLLNEGRVLADLSVRDLRAIAHAT